MVTRNSPVMLQYDRIKAQYPGHVVLIRLGDFYEAFDDDAQTLADVCDVALTGRWAGEGRRRLMAGVPWHASDSYIQELIQAGHKVAVAEQVGDAVNGVIPREVTREA